MVKISDHSNDRPAGFPPRSPRKSPHGLSSVNGGREPASKSESLRNLFAKSNSEHKNSTGGGSLRNLLSSGTGGSLRNLFSSSSHASTSGSANHHNSIKSDADYFAQGINLASMHASEHSAGSRDKYVDDEDDDGDSFHGDNDENEDVEEVPLSTQSSKKAFQAPATIPEKELDESMGSLQVSPQTSRDDHSRTSFLSSVGDLPFGDDV